MENENPTPEKKGGKLKILIILLIVVLVAGGAVLLGGGDFFKGYMKLSRTTEVEKSVTIKDITATEDGHLAISLASSSPSGYRIVSINDNVVEFNLCAKGNNVVIDGARFTFDSNSSDLGIYLDNNMIAIKEGSTVLNGNNHLDSIEFITYFSQPLTVAANDCTRLDFYVNTAELITQSVNDELLTVSLEELFIEGDATIDTAFPIEGNELRY